VQADAARAAAAIRTRPAGAAPAGVVAVVVAGVAGDVVLGLVEALEVVDMGTSWSGRREVARR